MAKGSPYYRVVGGEALVSHEGFALLMGIPIDTFKAEVRRQQDASGAPGEFSFRVPAPWAKAGRRIRKEVAAALGYEPGMAEAIDYLAATQETT